MNTLRFSLAKLLGAVVVVALGLGALVNATPLVSSVVFTASAAILFAGVIGVIYRRGGARAFWIGFIVFGWGYFATAFGPWLGPNVGQRLATSKVLSFGHERLRHFADPATDQSHVITLWFRANDDVSIDGKVVGLNRFAGGLRSVYGSVLAELATARAAGKTTLVAYRDDGAAVGRQEVAQLAGYNRMDLVTFADTQFFPSDEDFRQIGHSLFALLFALLGGVIGRYLYATRERTT